jgi:hypothetical protein
MVGVAALPVGKDDDARAETADDFGDFEAIFQGVLEGAIGEIKGFAVGDFEDCGGGSGLGFSFSSGAAGS